MGSDSEIILMETKGYSMYPFIRDGTRIIVRKTIFQDLSVGDIIVYNDNNKLVCHRVVKRPKDDFLFARADTNRYTLEIVTKDAFRGKVVGLIKNSNIIIFNGRLWQFCNFTIAKTGFFISRLLELIKIPIRPMYHFICQKR